MHPNVTMTNMCSHRARISGSREAIYDYDKNIHYTYADLDDRSERLAAFLVEKLGLRKGDRVAFCSENTVAWIDAFFSSYRTGIIMTSYNCMMGKKNLTYLIEKETPKVVFYSGYRKDVIEYYRQDGVYREYICILGEPDERDTYTYEDVMAYEPQGTAKYDAPELEDIQMLIHTGGTTGEPKAAMMSYRALMFNTISQVLSVGVSCEDSAYVFLPFFHTAGWNVLMMPLLMVGGRVILTAGFNPDTALKIIEEERPTTAIAIETMYQLMTLHLNFPNVDFSCFRWMLNGAAPISRETLEDYWAKGVRLVNAYGMTEIGPSNLVPPINTMSQHEIETKWNAAGKPLYFNEVRIVDDDGNDLPTGEHGELLFRGNLIFSGYWDDQDKTNDIVRDGWVHTGDIGYADEDGFYYICARKKNMYISGGENIYPAEIENVIVGHPDVADAAVIGVPDEKWGEVGKALVVRSHGSSLDKEQLQAHVKTGCSSIRVPKYVEFVEEIPKNSVGKLDLKVIREKWGFAGDAFDKPE